MRVAEDLNLWLFPPSLHGEARAAFEAGDVVGFLCRASNTDCLEIVASNVLPLEARGIYEPALLLAFSVTRTNNSRFPLAELRGLAFDLKHPQASMSVVRAPFELVFELVSNVPGFPGLSFVSRKRHWLRPPRILRQEHGFLMATI